MRTPKQAYDEATLVLAQRYQSAGASLVVHKEAYKLGLQVALEQLKLSFHGVFQEVASTQQAKPKPTLADFPNGLLGTWWRYSDHQAPGEVTKHDGDSIELDYPTSTDCISVDWLFKAYTRVEAPAEPGGEDVQCECSGHHNPWCIHFNQNLNG